MTAGGFGPPLGKRFTTGRQLAARRHPRARCPAVMLLHSLHDSCPRGNGRVQLRVVPFSVITTFAVAVPSYVMTSRRVTDVGAWPVYVTLACIARMTVPAVG